MHDYACIHDMCTMHSCMYRSPVKEWQVSWLILVAITLNGIDTTVKWLDKNVKTFSTDSSAIFANNGVCAIQSYCPRNKPTELPLFYWRPVRTCMYASKLCPKRATICDISIWRTSQTVRTWIRNHVSAAFWARASKAHVFSNKIFAVKQNFQIHGFDQDPKTTGWTKFSSKNLLKNNNGFQLSQLFLYKWRWLMCFSHFNAFKWYLQNILT